jgi:PAS domain S-box-containing protein
VVTKPTFKELQKKFEMLENELVRCRQREETYRSLVESSSDSLYMVDKNCRYLFANNSYLVRHGVSTENMIGRSYGDFHSKGQEIIFAKNITEAFDTGNYSQQEHKSEKGDKYFLRTFSPVRQRGPEGEITAVVVISLEITARKLINDALQESETKFRALMETTLSSSFVVQGEKFRYVNPAFERLSGYTLQDLHGLNFWDLVHPDFRQLVKERGFARQKHENIPARYEFKYVTKSGEVGWIDYAGTYIEFEGKPALLASGFDITERKKVEAALIESEIKYRWIFESFEDIYFQSDEKGIIRVLSPSVYRLTGWSPDELIGKPASDIYVRPKDREGLLAKLSTNGFLRDYEVFLKKKDGTHLYASLTASILTDPDGRPCGVAGTLRDITERKQAEEERQQSFEKLRKGLRATVQAISLTLEMKDPYTSGHQQRVSDLARSIATEMGLSVDRQDLIRTAASIHDIGKISIPSAILSKPTKLSDLEFGLIKTHSQSGYDILKDIEFPWPVADVVLQHHERINGSGYPQGLKGNAISLEARILGVADVVEAIAFHRPYRPSLGIYFALQEIARNKDILYDADVVDVCLKLFQEKNYTMVIKSS